MLIGKRIVQALLILIAALLIFVIFVFASNLTIKTSRFNPFITYTIESYAGLQILIDGDISVTPGWVTTIGVEGIRWQENDAEEIPFLKVGHSELSLDLMSLFDEEIIIEKVILSELELNLIAEAGMKFNIPELDFMGFLEWINLRVKHIPPFIAADIQLKSVWLRFLAPEKSLKGQFVFDQIDARWGWNTPLWLMGDGTIDEQHPKPVTIAAKGGAFRTLGDASQEWKLSFNLAGDKADILTELTLSGEGIDGLEKGENVLAKNRDYELLFKVNKLQYGAVLSHLGLEDAGHGSLDASVFLKGNLVNLDHPLTNSTGTIELAVWPDSLRANPLDFWAVNIVNQLFRSLNEDSKVNCAVARFDLSEGTLSSDVMIFDTSRLRVYGDGNFNLISRELDFWVEAKAKQIQWISKDVPVRIKGSLDKPEIELKKTRLLTSTVKTVVNFALPLLPVLINDTMESDGSKDCLQSMQDNSGQFKD